MVDIYVTLVYTINKKGYKESFMNTSTLSEKGWVVIPQELRRRYGLKKGDRLHIIDYGGVISLVPASEDPIKTSLGMLKGKTSLVKALAKSRQQDAERGK
jgi:AbrB family looped-hinge helix DNA binding protein